MNGTIRNSLQSPAISCISDQNTPLSTLLHAFRLTFLNPCGSIYTTCFNVLKICILPTDCSCASYGSHKESG
jgi:hypothetical protein